MRTLLPIRFLTTHALGVIQLIGLGFALTVIFVLAAFIRER